MSSRHRRQTHLALGTVGVCVPLPDLEPGTERSEFLSEAIEDKAAEPAAADDDDDDDDVLASLEGVDEAAVGAIATGGGWG